MRRNSSPTDRSDNFARRLKQTMDTESDPEMFTPNTAGAEELTSYEENFPLVEEFNQTNMRSGGKRPVRSTQKQAGKSND